MRLIRLKKNTDTDDATLIREYRRSEDKAIIGVLFDRYSGLVYGVCMKYLKNEDDSKDAVLQIFEKLMTDLKKYEISRFSSWLHSVAKNFCFMQLRNREALFQRSATLGDHEAFMESHAESSLEDVIVHEQQLTNLEKAMQSLSIEQKVCVELFYLREESYQDIADLTGYTLNQVKSYIQNGKRNLKIYLQKAHHETER